MDQLCENELCLFFCPSNSCFPEGSLLSAELSGKLFKPTGIVFLSAPRQSFFNPCQAMANGYLCRLADGEIYSSWLLLFCYWYLAHRKIPVSGSD
jgi:hypothetical protein